MVGEAGPPKGAVMVDKLGSVLRRASRTTVAVAALCFALPCAAGAVELAPGDILVADRGSGIIRVDPATGAQTTISSGGLFSEDNRPSDIAVEADGDILVTDLARLIRVDPATGAQTIVSSGGSFSDPVGVAVEADGDILVADQEAFGERGGVIRVDPVTGAQTTVSSGGSFWNPQGVAVEGDGDILVADPDMFPSQLGGVIRVDPVTGAQATVSSGGSFGQPEGVEVEADGDIVIADLTAFSVPDHILGGVIRVDPVTGAQTTVSAGTSSAQFNPFRIALEPDGDIVVTDRLAGGVDNVIRVDPTTGERKVVSTGGLFEAPVGIAVVPPRPAVGLAPTSLNFGNGRRGSQSAPRRVTLTNTGDAALSVGSAALTGGGAADYLITANDCAGAAIAPGQTCTVDVAFRPRASGVRSAALRFTDNAADSPQTVGLTGRGCLILIGNLCLL
jgi:sugar lactone lactonase YvrE